MVTGSGAVAATGGPHGTSTRVEGLGGAQIPIVGAAGVDGTGRAGQATACSGAGRPHDGQIMPTSCGVGLRELLQFFGAPRGRWRQSLEELLGHSGDEEVLELAS